MDTRDRDIPDTDAKEPRFMRVGLTGGIAAGKSTVAQRLKEKGAVLIDYDGITHQLQQPGSPAIEQIRERFGNGAVAPDGSLDRAGLAQMVFASPQAVADLNHIMHPLVYRFAKSEEKRALEQSLAGMPLIVVHDIPLLAQVRATLPFSFAHVVTVEAPEDLRVERLVRTRGMSEAQARARMANQSTEEERRRIADVVVDSTQPLEQMFEKVDRLYSQWSSELEQA